MYDAILRLEREYADKLGDTLIRGGILQNFYNQLASARDFVYVVFYGSY